MPTVIRPTWKPTAEQDRLLAATREAWKAARKAEDRAWQLTQSLRDAGVPDLAICERIEEVTKPTLNRRLGPRSRRQT